MYVTEGRGGAESAVRVLCGLMSEAAAEAFVLVSSTPQMAAAVVVTAGGVLPEMALAAEAEAYLKNGC